MSPSDPPPLIFLLSGLLEAGFALAKLPLAKDYVQVFGTSALFSFGGLPYIYAYYKKLNNDQLLPIAIGAAVYHLLTTLTIGNMVKSEKKLEAMKVPKLERPLMKVALGMHAVLAVMFARWVMKHHQ
ncbi:hypothetical protein HDV05_003965 [Chytridiales sp. JEL 0842]|nr:hypothetical protein HDV05_003965 [Chytridiales sp. JEL 0842]